MEKILGIDLGTNSIGLTLRDGCNFDWYAVYTFKKGVGEGKTGEFSYAAERTQHRSSRRLYNARRYRKWETLKILLEYGFCPLQKENLENWIHYDTNKDKEGRSIGRLFPINDDAFNNWIKLDFDGDGIPDFTSPYQLRKLLIEEKLDLSLPENRYKIGRAFYHIAQRRGFRSSRKGGANEKTAINKGSKETKTIGRDEYKELIEDHKTIGAAFAFLENAQTRIRNRYTLRSDYQNEVQTIIDFQEISDKLFIERIEKAIFFQRPLRSQKGLVGRCTLEPNKHRCPISHPKFEEYRAWSFINNIKYRSDDNEFLPLPLELKESLYREKFFFKSKREILFSEIREYIRKNGDRNWDLNYSPKMDKISVSTCYVSARLKSVFGEDWESFEKKIERKKRNGEKEITTYTIEDVWHILFSYENEDCFIDFLSKNLSLEENQIKELLTLFNSFPIGYASLSLKAINNILPFLREGLIYSEAVILAKIPEILGDQFLDNKKAIINAVKDEISRNRHEKMIVSIANNLIFKYYALDYQSRFGWKDNTYRLQESDLKDVEISAKEHFGEKTWGNLSNSERDKIISEVAEKYQKFFEDEKREHLKPPHLVAQIKDFLDTNFDVSEKDLQKIYHPSQIDIYPRKEDQQFLASPKTGAFKNPMVYKALHKLRKVINYLIETGRIDGDTRMVVEIARELNDSNKRWAIETFQREREEENRKYAAVISELIKDDEFLGIADPNNDDDIDKFRLWVEQIENYEDFLKQLSDVDKNKSVSEREIQKYRLWKEQNCICMYTGKYINLTDLFDRNKVDFEHTIPRSKSFDNSLANLTVCYADYNRNIKKNKLPVELPNYEEESRGYSAIKPRLESWEKKIESLKSQIETQNKNSKNAMDKESKDTAIRRRHLLQMKCDYWRNKVDRFKRTEVPQGFVNSQLSDTQIITKYAFHYLKTVFNKVDVVKGTNTAQFRKIYGIESKLEKKSRDSHFHHAIDAAILTLIPSAKRREEILKKAYEFEEDPKNSNRQYHEKPFSSFSHSMIEEIKKNILINNLVDTDRTLAAGKKNVRKRGRMVWVDKEKRIPKIAQGDSIRGELHKQTYYGKIKIAETDDQGRLIRNDNGEILYKKDKGKDVYCAVLRKPIDSINFDKKKGLITDSIVDVQLKKHLESQLENGVEKDELKDFNGKIIRHIRCKERPIADNLLPIKEQVYKSSKEHKNNVYVMSGDIYLFAIYENDKGRELIPITIFDASQYISNFHSSDKRDLFKMKEPVMIKGQEAELVHICETGQKVLFFKNLKEELKELYETDREEFSKRLYYVKGLPAVNDKRVRYQYHLEARSDAELDNLGNLEENKSYPKSAWKIGFSKLQEDFVAPRLRLNGSASNFIVEGKDFEMNLDGTIEFKF